MGVFLILSIVLNVVLGYTTINNLKKNEALEDYIIQLRGTIAQTITNMRSLDDREMFESDDEVGVIFNQLVEEVNTISTFLGEDVIEKRAPKNRIW